MKPVTFPEQNISLGKPEGMTDEQCGSLPAFQGHDPEGFPVIVSCWELSPEELEQVQETGKIYLVVISPTQPPLSLRVDSPFE